MSVLNDTNGNMVMPVSPMYGNGGGMWGNDGGLFWLLVLFLFGFAGNGWSGGFGNNAMPYMLNNTTNNDVQRGFDQQAIINGLNGINSAVTNGFAQAEISANSRQMADMQQAFAMQSQLANCGCENRAGIADLKYTIATENCADRSAISDGIRDLLANQAANTQKILDQMCADKIDAKNEQIANLQSQLNMATLRESQTAQTAAILANNQAQTQALEQYLNPAPIPAYVVQNPNCCSQNYGCGCGVA